MSYYMPMDNRQALAEYYDESAPLARSQLPYHSFHPQQFAAMPMHHEQGFGQPERMPSLPGTQPTVQDVTVSQKKMDEPDPSCRPRLTTEQTNTLEHYFHNNPRPNTQEKRVHAMELGLTLEKVNNWYQNRRAKVKQQNRTRKDFGVFAYGDAAWQQRHDYSSEITAPGFCSPSLHGSESEPTPTLFSSEQVGTFQFQGKAQDEAAWKENRHRFMSGLASSDNGLPAAFPDSEAFASNDSTGPEYEVFVDQFYQNADESCPPPHFHAAQWDSSHGSFVNWPLAQQTESPNDQDPAYVQQLVASTQLAHASNVDLRSVHLGNNSSQLQSSPQHVHEVQQSYEQSSNNTSPVPSMQTLPPQNFSRRNSNSSELTTNFDSFNLHRAGSQQNSDEEVLNATQIIQQSNLAVRRKRQRPAPLGNLRSLSYTTTNLQSPGSKPKVLRHAKSAGNGLNVLNGRVLKSGASSAQRSPLHLGTFQEAASAQRAHSFSAQSTLDASMVPSTVQPAPNTPPELNDPVSDCGYFPRSTLAEGYGHATMAPVGYPGAFVVTSPPASPFVHASLYGHHHAYMAPPQSAPAHISSFANVSPPMHPMPETPNFFPPQANLPESYGFYSGGQMGSHLQMPSYHLGQPMIHTFTPPQIASHSPVLPTYYNPYGSSMQQPSPPPKKELEVILSTFPTPAGSASPPKIVRPQQYTFQNSGPCDFESDSS